MLQPARRKYRKEQKGRNTGLATRGAKVSFGEYGLKAIGRGRLTARQIEAARRAGVSRYAASTQPTPMDTASAAIRYAVSLSSTFRNAE